MTAPRIFSNAVFTLKTAQEALHLKESCLKREIRLKRLRVSRRAGRYFILGQWLLEWIEQGEKENPNPSRRPTRRAGLDLDGILSLFKELTGRDATKAEIKVVRARLAAAQEQQPKPEGKS